MVGGGWVCASGDDLGNFQLSTDEGDLLKFGPWACPERSLSELLSDGVA